MPTKQIKIFLPAVPNCYHAATELNTGSRKYIGLHAFHTARQPNKLKYSCRQYQTVIM